MLTPEKRKALKDSGHFDFGSAIDFVNQVLTQPGDTLLTEQDLEDYAKEQKLETRLKND